jgi:hypothetical protein
LEFEKDNFCLYLQFIKSHENGPSGVHAVTSFGDIKKRPCKDLSTKSLFERVLAVTSATVDVMAKSFRRPCKVHFSQQQKMDISDFQQGAGDDCLVIYMRDV